MEQRSDEWFAARGGCVTGSRVADIMADGVGRKNYMAELVAYRLTGRSEENFTTAAMQRGIDLEMVAIAEYEMRNFANVEQVGIVYHPTITGFAGSPDGLVGTEGGLEIKCPNTATHIDTLLNDTIKKGYIIQIQSYMAVTGRAWFDFVSFDDRLPDDLSFYQKRILRDDKMIKDIESAVQKFLFELDALEQMLREKA
jgi:putative phage-type endonuclease